MDFYAVCIDIESGKAVYKNCKRFENHNFDWLRASASMPLVSQIVEIDGYKLLDGGIADSIPVKYFESIGFNKNIVVLTQPKGYVKEKNSLVSLMKIKYRKYPKLIEAMANRHIMYNDAIKYIEEKEKNEELYVIRPESNLPISRTEKDPEKLRAVYEIGRKVATEKIDEIKKFLNIAD